MIRPTLRTLMRTLSRRGPRARRPWRKRFRPQLEGLEGRLAPAIVTWINPAGGLWSVGSNWSGGAVPGPADDVTIDVGADTQVTHSVGADSVHTLTNRSTLQVTNTSALTVTAGFTQGFDGELLADTGTFVADGPAGSAHIDSATLFAANGGVIRIPSATSYTDTTGADFSGGFVASGLGSVVDLHNMTTITNTGGGLASGAFDGALLDLSGVTAIQNLNPAAPLDIDIGGVQTGPASRVNLTALTSFSGGGNLEVFGGAGSTMALNPATTTISGPIRVDLLGGGVISTGTLRLAAGASLYASANANLPNTGTITGNLVVDGSRVGLFPGARLLVMGDYTPNATATLTVFFDPFNGYGQLAVNGRATLDGTQEVNFQAGFTTRPGDQFQVLSSSSGSGTFARYTGDSGGFSFLYVYDDTNSVFPAGLTLVAN
jgi:hypothetical protein